MIKDFTEIQFIQLRAIMTEFHVVFDSSRSFDSLKKFEAQRSFDVNVNDEINRFNLNNVNYFDSFYESKSIDIVFIIEYIDKSIFFCDIHVFINRVKNVARIKSDIILR